MSKPLETVIVGGGHRSLIYANLSEIKPDMMKIVGIVDPNDFRRRTIAERFSIPEEHIFSSVEEFVQKPKFADAVINGTMDHIHVETSLPIIKAGYDILLEKPFAVNEKEMRELVATANEYDKKIMVCFVLRYAPFYRKIKETILSGVIGDIVNIQTVEHVSYHHMSTSHIRGKWRNEEECHASMLLAKCCHDIDIMMWLMGNDAPIKVSSFGGLMQFRRENAPKNSGTRCLVDCPLVDSCLYSAKRIYLDHPDRWSFYVWDKLEDKENATLEDKRELLKSSPYGICAYKSDNNVVDHQSLNVLFKSGATGTHNMIGGTAIPQRKIHIIGTKGEISGTLESGIFTVSLIDPRPGCEHCDTEYNVRVADDSHGGGDLLLTEDFVNYVRDNILSVSCTSINESVKGHLTVFKADESMKNGGRVEDIIL
jgi:hypothetical protein